MKKINIILLLFFILLNVIGAEDSEAIVIIPFINQSDDTNYTKDIELFERDLDLILIQLDSFHAVHEDFSAFDPFIRNDLLSLLSDKLGIRYCIMGALREDLSIELSIWDSEMNEMVYEKTGYISSLNQISNFLEEGLEEIMIWLSNGNTGLSSLTFTSDKGIADYSVYISNQYIGDNLTDTITPSGDTRVAVIITDITGSSYELGIQNLYLIPGENKKVHISYADQSNLSTENKTNKTKGDESPRFPIFFDFGLNIPTRTELYPVVLNDNFPELESEYFYSFSSSANISIFGLVSLGLQLDTYAQSFSYKIIDSNDIIYDEDQRKSIGVAPGWQVTFGNPRDQICFSINYCTGFNFFNNYSSLGINLSYKWFIIGIKSCLFEVDGIDGIYTEGAYTYHYEIEIQSSTNLVLGYRWVL